MFPSESESAARPLTEAITRRHPSVRHAQARGTRGSTATGVPAGCGLTGIGLPRMGVITGVRRDTVTGIMIAAGAVTGTATSIMTAGGVGATAAKSDRHGEPQCVLLQAPEVSKSTQPAIRAGWQLKRWKYERKRRDADLSGI